MLLLFPWISLLPDRQGPLHFCFIPIYNGLYDNRGTDNSPANSDGPYRLRSDMFSIFFLCIVPCLFISVYQHQSLHIMNQYTLYSQYTISLLLNSLVILFFPLCFLSFFFFFSLFSAIRSRQIFILIIYAEGWNKETFQKFCKVRSLIQS